MVTDMISKEQFEAYEKVRKSGETNMFAVGRVSILSGLSLEEIREIMHKYSELKRKWGATR